LVTGKEGSKQLHHRRARQSFGSVGKAGGGKNYGFRKILLCQLRAQRDQLETQIPHTGPCKSRFFFSKGIL